MAVSNPVTADGLHLGMLVEIHGAGVPQESLGQLVGFSTLEEAEEDEEAELHVVTIGGMECTLKPENVRAPEILERPGLGGGPSSFDVLVGPRLRPEVMGEEIARCLFEKGFCVLRVCQDEEDVKEVLASMQARGRSGKLQRFPEEVEEGYLGNGAMGKVVWLDADNPDAPRDVLLARSDNFISTLARLVQPFCPDFLGKPIDERTPALVSLTLLKDEEPDFPPLDADDATLGQFFRTWRRSLLKVVHFMGPASSSVTLESKGEDATRKLPYEQDSVEIDAKANTILLFEPGVFEHSVRCDGEALSVSATFLEPEGKLEIVSWEGDEDFLCSSGPSGPQGEYISVVNLSTRLMANWDIPEAYRAGLYVSADSGKQIPYERWDIQDYYNEDTDTLQFWQAPSKHQSVVEGVELFDNKYFEINNTEAAGMDPLHRLVLEVGATNLWKLGISKKDTNRKTHNGGCSVGLDKDDWEKVPNKPQGTSSNNQAILSNRFSFIFNLRGPSYVADTACSASLTATHLAKYPLMGIDSERLDFHVAIGVHLCLHPSVFTGGKGNTMISPIGRCLTFNATASGYMRGDGCSGLTLKYGNHKDERQAIWRASQLGQNGRSATLTAPNGLAQQEIIEKAYHECKISPPESAIWNCHGTGTSLGDPIEVGAVRRTQIKEPRKTALLLLTNKTHTGHLEGGAAMTSLIGATLQVMHGAGIPILHFRQLNPNLEQSRFDAVINNEMSVTNYSRSHVHISSFGFGGTNGHVIMWGDSLITTLDMKTAILRRLQNIPPPQVRVSGSSPNDWEWDGPDKDVRVGDRWQVNFNSDDPEDTPARWEKVASAPEPDDGEDDFYCITGPFNEWDTDRMEEGQVRGLSTITIEVPEDGILEFRFLKNAEEEEIIYPPVDRCTRKAGPVLGPVKEDNGREKNVWLAKGPPGGEIRVELFACRGMRSVTWMPVDL